jgi:hypothetical protein
MVLGVAAAGARVKTRHYGTGRLALSHLCAPQGHYRLAPAAKFVIIDYSVRIEPDRKRLCAEPDCTQSNQEEKQRGVTLASSTHRAREICTA